MSNVALFPDDAGTRRGPAPYAESAYHNLARSAHPQAVQARDLLDGWYGRLPQHARPDLRQRFTRDADMDHLGAFWELYLHESMLRSGFQVQVNIGRDDEKRPDFLLARDGQRIWLEATAARGDEITAPGAGKVKDIIDRAHSPNFLLGVEITAHTNRTPSAKAITRQIEAWVRTLNPDVEKAAQDAGAPPSSHTVSDAGWTIDLDAIPRRPDLRGSTGRNIGTTIEGSGWVDEIKPLRSKLKAKAGRYGDLDAPYVIAVLCAGIFVEDAEIEAVLFGPGGYRPDGRVTTSPGLWQGPVGPQNRRVSAVLTAVQLSPRAVAHVDPVLWLNPWARHPVDPALFPYATRIVTGGQMSGSGPSKTAAELLGL